MRRKDREQNDREFLEKVLDKAEVLSLAMLDNGLPYCIPVNFCRSGNILYIHCAKVGHKLDCIGKNPNVAFCAYMDVKIVPEKASTYYKSICGAGKTSLVTDPVEKGHALDLLGLRYNALCQRPAPAAMLQRVEIIRIDILKLTGKACLPD